MTSPQPTPEMTSPRPAAPDALIRADFVERLRRHISRRVGDLNDRDDIVQEALARVLARVNSGALASADIEPYAFRIASNLVIDGFRRQGKRTVEMPEELASDDPSQDRVVEARRELSEIMKVIEGMPPLRRSVFTLVRVEGYTHKRVSEELGVSQKAIEKHMSRAFSDIVQARRRMKERSPGGKGSRDGR